MTKMRLLIVGGLVPSDNQLLRNYPAAIELPRGLRINVVSPTVLAESLNKYGDFFAGYVPVPVAIVAKAYAKSVEGAQTGQVYCVG